MGNIDPKIINHLQSDGRKSFTEIAKAVEVSESAVRRIKNLSAYGGGRAVISATLSDNDTGAGAPVG
jgi:DNA-binding Lrp family transcriptional regulator